MQNPKLSPKQVEVLLGIAADVARLAAEYRDNVHPRRSLERFHASVAANESATMINVPAWLGPTPSDRVCCSRSIKKLCELKLTKRLEGNRVAITPKGKKIAAELAE